MLLTFLIYSISLSAKKACSQYIAIAFRDDVMQCIVGEMQHLERVPSNASQGNADSCKLLGRHLVTKEGNAAGQHNDELEVANHIECEA